LARRTGFVEPGTYAVKAQLRLSQVSNASSQCMLSAWHFLVEQFTT
jgi:hypothetical protein